MGQLGHTAPRSNNPTGAPPLWPQQSSAVYEVRRRLAVTGGSGLWARVGNGKSRVALETLIQEGCRRILIVAPRFVAFDVWPDQVNQWAPRWRFTDLTHQSTRRRADHVERDRHHTPWAAAVNYEALRSGVLMDALLRAGFDGLICDEIHRVGAPGGAHSKQVRKLAAVIPKRLGLSATPYHNSRGALALWAYTKALVPALMPSNFTPFRHFMTEPCRRDDSDGTWPTGPNKFEYYRIPEASRQWFQDFDARMAWTMPDPPSVRDLAPAQDIRLTVTLEPSARKEYRRLERQRIAEFDGADLTAPHVLPRLLRLQQITSGWFHPDKGEPKRISKAKAAALETIVAGAAEPVVVFSRYRKDLETVHEVAAKCQRSSFEVSRTRRELADWRAAARVKTNPVLAVQIQTGSEGVTMVDAALAVFYSPDYSLQTFDQCRGRLHRPGQTRQVRYIHLVVPESIDQAIYNALDRRQDFVSALRDRSAPWPPAHARPRR